MSDFEQLEIEKKWQNVLQFVGEKFGQVEDIKDVVFLIGIQELGFGFRKFTKDEKIDVIHVGVCSLLSQYGYYEFIGRDKDGWPHWELTTPLPEMSEKDNEALMKQSIIDFFNQ